MVEQVMCRCGERRMHHGHIALLQQVCERDRLNLVLTRMKASAVCQHARAEATKFVRRAPADASESGTAASLSPASARIFVSISRFGQA